MTSDLLEENQDLKKQIAELEKENAELKRDKEDLIFIRNQNAKCMCEDKEQLTKAKEIIKKFLLWENDWHNKTKSKYELLKQAEQFISEEAK